MNEITVITGPTASGKSAYAIGLALKTGAEIVSADSMQIYRHMDVGAAKTPPGERAGVPHHMIDVADPDERFSVADYQRVANACIADILARGRNVIVAGGTGLYISALIYNTRFPAYKPDPELRARLAQRAAEIGAEGLHAELAAVDAEAAAKIHTNDIKRATRALEVYYATGATISEHARLSRAAPPPYEYRVYCMDVARDELYRRIDARVDAMIRLGLEAEARAIFDRYGRGGTAAQAIGYKEFLPYFDGLRTLPETVDTIKMETRRYAKRQMTWFRQISGITFVSC